MPFLETPMSAASMDPRLPFFDELAERWDRLENMDSLPQRLAQSLARLGVGAHERVLEVGCGTGNLTLALTHHLGPDGRIFAVDCSERMLEKARAKVEDVRVSWVLAPVQAMPPELTAMDRVILMGVWPHLDDKPSVLDELHRRLRPGGMLHIWHLASRDCINRIHAGAHPAVAGDLLEPAEQIAEQARAHGFAVLEALDDDTSLLVSARRS